MDQLDVFSFFEEQLSGLKIYLSHQVKLLSKLYKMYIFPGIF